MGRTLSSNLAMTINAGAGNRVLLPGQLPLFNTGRFRTYYRDMTFVVPADVYSIRARVHGGGGGITTAGGTSSFGALLSATGGGIASGATPGTGGIGVGGDFQAAGAPGGASLRSGGGAAGSEMGPGGPGGLGIVNAAGGGGAVGGRTGGTGVNMIGGAGASPWYDGTNGTATAELGGAYDAFGLTSVANAPGWVDLPWPTFAFLGAGGHTTSYTGINGGPGAGGSGSGAASLPGGHGGVLAGGGATAVTDSYPGFGGCVYPANVINTPGYLPANPLRRIGGGRGGDPNRAGSGGGGYARGVFAVTPGQTFNIVVAAQATDNAGGLVIVEW